jgi:putative peptide zinc metalloprotease protein
VNTADGAVRYAVSFALVWADGDTALQRNEAYALAGCTGCTTVAVAFQVVLVLGSVHVVAPQNLSAAVNYGCVRCLTYALAEQLVLTVPGQLDPQAGADLAAVWASLAAFGRDLQDVPLAEIQTRLQQYEQQISAIVRRSADAEGAANPSTAAPSSSPTATGSGAAGTTGGATAGATDATSAPAVTRSPAPTTSGSPAATSSAVPSTTSAGTAPDTATATPTDGTAGATG